jgi:glycosyltransferase involved in cell wall biosynthesis
MGKSPSDILIYHHSIHWETGEILLANTKMKIAVKYHNVTPPCFFKDYANHYYQACLSGIAATRRVARHPSAWFWGDSAFNVNELFQCGAPEDRCRVIPPFHRIEEELSAAPLDTVVTGQCRRAAVNILFVGGIRPNKGHMKAVEVFAAYREISIDSARLVFAGTYDTAFSKYLHAVQAHATRLGVDKHVTFDLSVTPSQLRAYYLNTTVFLCTSEHEGFCVPLAEAMYFRAPIVAWANTAVGETCGDAGMLIREFDPLEIARAVDDCASDANLARALGQRARSRYDAVFSARAIDARLLKLVWELEKQ